VPKTSKVRAFTPLMVISISPRSYSHWRLLHPQMFLRRGFIEKPSIVTQYSTTRKSLAPILAVFFLKTLHSLHVEAEVLQMRLVLYNRTT
jgi:hypothetical protein